MRYFSVFDNSAKNKWTTLRSSEVKLGERVDFPENGQSVENFLLQTNAKYVIFGIAEDIGVKANFGRTGTKDAWENTIQSLLNIQHNRTCKGNWIAVLGNFSFDDWQKEASYLDPKILEDRKRLFQIVSEIDKEVTYLITKIVQAKKIPIVIGGGHNNSYGNIKGLAIAKNRAVNVINLDAHTDFRILEGRHSGNGFSYAYEEGFLEKYFIFGLHESYTSKAVFDRIKELSPKLKYNSFEQIKVRLEKNFTTEIQQGLLHVKDAPYGIEIDLDCIEKTASSAISPVGFSPVEARQFIHFMGNHKNASYLHLCEGAPKYDSSENPNLIGKLNAYFITDFIKAKENI